MTNKQRLGFKCWNPKCTHPNEIHSILVDAGQDGGLLLIACPYCDEESEVDLSDPKLRTTLKPVLRSEGSSIKLDQIDANSIIPTRPRTSKKE